MHKNYYNKQTNKQTNEMRTVWNSDSVTVQLWNTCDVPQLKTDCLLVPVENFKGKIHSDCSPVVGAEVVMHVALDDAGLANSEVSNHKDLIQMFLLVVVVHGDRGVWELRMNRPGLRGMVGMKAQAEKSKQSSGRTERKGWEARPSSSWKKRGQRIAGLVTELRQCHQREVEHRQ